MSGQHRAKVWSARPGESGQAAVSLVLLLGLFLLGVMGFAVDLTNMWFHRQTAMAAADAACLAGAMDMLSTSAGVTPKAAGFTAGTASNCASTPKATMCSYANDNGYNGTGLSTTAASNAVSWTFPSSVPGVTAGAGTNPFLQVTIAENVKTFFMGLLTHKKYQEVAVSSTCGIAQILSPAPMIVLNPSASGAFTYSGGTSSGITIVGGPARGLQVNSTSSTAIKWSPSAIINLSEGGPNLTGSDVGVTGNEPSPPSDNTGTPNFEGGSTGQWQGNVLPISDPYGSVPVPASIKSETPANGTSGKSVSSGTDGCTDASNGCMEMSPGYYPSGLTTDGYKTYIFDPGIYYFNGSLDATGSSTMRMAQLSTTKQTDGVMFYFYTGSLNVSGCSGCSNPNPNVNPTALTCDGSSPNSALGMTSSELNGNVLWAPCTTRGTYVDSTDNPSDSTGKIRGLMIFEDHSDTTSPSFTGSGSMAFSGALYFHNTSYSDNFSFSGASGAHSFVLGEIVTDEVTFSGSSSIDLALNPTPSVELSKVGMFQ